MSRDPHTTLFEAHVAPLTRDAHVLLSNVADADFIASLSRRVRSIAVFHRSHAALEEFRRAVGNLSNVTISDAVFPPADREQFDLALVQIPKGRGFSRAVLATALGSLRPGKMLYAAGPNSGGANTAQSDLEALVQVEAPTLATKARHRIFAAAAPGEINPPSDWESPWLPRKQTFEIHEKRYEVYTQPGVFSHDHLDPGTATLIDALLPRLGDFPRGSTVLDAACGYGILGLVAQRELSPACVVFTDVDLLALSCLKRTSPEAMVVASDLTHSPPLPRAPFDLILCNPPFHQEHAKDLSLMHAFAPYARKVLNRGGQLALVANSFLPYRKLLAPHFCRVETLACTPQYQVLLCGESN